ncbi:MAG: OmpA family protein [Alphaproteobacteria bacterium]|nr:OmpA family protein [Alphaproteobacteria bacterium]
MTAGGVVRHRCVRMHARDACAATWDSLGTTRELKSQWRQHAACGNLLATNKGDGRGNPAMSHAARITHRARRRMLFAACGAFALSVGGLTAVPVHAQSAYGYTGSSVIVDYSVLDRLGPAPHVPDGRFVLRVSARPSASRTHVALHHVVHRHPRHLVRRIAHHPVRHLVGIVHDGSVTIDYAALPPRIDTSGPRIVLRRPGTATVAAAAPTVDQPEAPLTPPPRVHASAQQTVVLTPPAPRPTPSPTPPETPLPRVATVPSAPASRADPPELSSLLPIGGVALAATRSPTKPVSNVPQSDNRAIHFAPGNAELQGDAQAVLDALAQKLKTVPDERIQLVAYASGNSDQAIEARRVSLARAVMVRAYLIQHGVASTRIDVRALGNRVTGGGAADRVDLVTVGQ